MPKISDADRRAKASKAILIAEGLKAQKVDLLVIKLQKKPLRGVQYKLLTVKVEMFHQI